MRSLQEVICEIIYRIANVPNIFDHSNDVLYGLKNYIARHSLASENYFISIDAEELFKQNGFSYPFLRKWLDKKKFTYEHPIPANIVCKQIQNSDRTIECIRNILTFADCVTIVTKEQDQRLTQAFASRMPDGWTYLTGDKFARYKQIGIVLSNCTIPVVGALVKRNWGRF
jgi:hypothetical protein